MENQFNTQDVTQRAGQLTKRIRSNNLSPVIVAGLVGGIAGALTATLVARRSVPNPPAPVEELAVATGPKRPLVAGWSIRDVVELLMAVVPLAKQVQELYQERNRNT